VKRTRLLVTATVLAAAALGQAGVAAADDTATPTPSPTPSPAATAATATPTAAATTPANTAPVAVDDRGGSVVAGGKVTVKVLANDTDDGLGHWPEGEPPHLEIATFDKLTDQDGDRVTQDDATHTTLTVTARAADAGTTLRFTYFPTDGELRAAKPATVTVSVTTPPKPPAPHTVSLTTAGQVVALRHYTLHGAVSPVAGRPTVAVQRLVAGRWKVFRSTRAASTGRYGVAFSTNRPQRYVFRSVATWPNGKRATSARVNRTVVARPDVRVSGPLTRSAVRWSYRAGCPVKPSGLRRITINRFTYGHMVARGSLVVRAGAVPDLLRVFKASFASRFPVRSMKPTDAFYAGGRRTPTQSDVAAMKADNTSAFNCRPVTGNPYRVSQHSYGNAIDINTVRNPYVVGSTVYPSFARTYLDRSHVRTGMITRSGVIASTMRRNGWPWGARWSHPDYQHFSANGG
jgi:hypothetical protein